MAKIFKAAVVGMGGIGNTHATCIKNDPLAELVAVCDLKKQRADDAAEKFGVPAYYSLKDMLAAHPEILILDDSSSALDYKTDAALRRALAENMQDTTVVTVAQRVSSVKDCDLILVLNEGKIIGMGNHDHLLENCEEYREISDSQMGGAFVD